MMYFMGGVVCGAVGLFTVMVVLGEREYHLENARKVYVLEHGHRPDW